MRRTSRRTAPSMALALALPARCAACPACPAQTMHSSITQATLVWPVGCEGMLSEALSYCAFAWLVAASCSGDSSWQMSEYLLAPYMK